METDRSPRVEVVGRLDPEEIRLVSALVERATEVDGVRPLSEHVTLHLRYGGEDPVRNVLAYLDGELAGYAHLDVTDLVAGSSAEVVVDPSHRRHGLGRVMVRTLLAESPDGRLRLWAHGEEPSARALATSMGFVVSRELRQMRRSLYSALPDALVPDGVTVRTFESGVDDGAWVELNAEAFNGHPEQGAWTVEDLHQRMAEPWFDPAGFFVGVRDDRMVGFHWTKVHGGSPDHGHDELGPHAHDGHAHDPIGEVYVLGVDPSERGTGLGRALTVLGLRHLRALGLPEVMLFVDADNPAAIALYTRLGFTHWDTDVMFRAPIPPTPPPR